MTGPVVDLGAVRLARSNLRTIIAAHPELRSPERSARIVAAASDPTEDRMKRLDQSKSRGNTPAVAVRLPADLLAAVDAEAERLNGSMPGARFSRSDVIRMTLERALETAPTTASKPKSKPRPAPKSGKGATGLDQLRARIAAAVKAGHRQGDIAKRAKVQPATVSRIMKGGKVHASDATLGAIAAALDTLGA